MKKILLIIFVVIIAVILIFAAIVIDAPDKEIQVVPNKHPIAIIDSPGDGQVFSMNEVINFSATSSTDPEGENVYFSWKSNITGRFGDGVTFKSKLNVGYHEISLTVTDGKGAENTTVIRIIVYAIPFVFIKTSKPDRDYYSTERIFLNGSNSSSEFSSELNYTWRSDIDGILGYYKNLFANLSVGIHNITLEVSDGLTTVTKNITIEIIENVEPIVVITSPKYNDIFLVSSDILFDGSNCSDPNGQDLDFNWTSNIDGLIGINETFYSNLSAGVHIITLTVDDGYGCSSEEQIVITVNTPPIADAGPDLVKEVGEKTEFNASNSFDLDGDKLTYGWDFGDGYSKAGKIVSHSYLHEGKYNVTLTVEDGKGGIANDSLEVEVIYIFRGTGVYGYVYNNKTQKTIPGIEIYAWSWDWNNDTYYENETETDAFGYYEFHTPAGEIWLDCYKDGYISYYSNVTVGKNKGILNNIYLKPMPPENAKIFGYVYDNDTKEPLYDADIELYNKEIQYYTSTYTEKTGYYEISVPAGTFTLECYYYDWQKDLDFETHHTQITFQEYQIIQYDIYLLRERPTEINITIEFTTWDQISLTQVYIEYSNTYWKREWMDQDYNGEVTQEEVDEYEEMEESWYKNSSFDIEDLLFVDNITYNYVENSMDIEIEGAVGSVSSSKPLITIYNLKFESDTTIPISDSHDIRLNVNYDDSDYKYIYYIKFPTKPTQYEMTNYTATKFVEVSGKNLVKIDPGDDPEPNDDYYSEWVKIEAAKK